MRLLVLLRLYLCSTGPKDDYVEWWVGASSWGQEVCAAGGCLSRERDHEISCFKSRLSKSGLWLTLPRRSAVNNLSRNVPLLVVPGGGGVDILYSTHLRTVNRALEGGRATGKKALAEA